MFGIATDVDRNEGNCGTEIGNEVPKLFDIEPTSFVHECLIDFYLDYPFDYGEHNRAGGEIQKQFGDCFCPCLYIFNKLALKCEHALHLSFCL